MKLICMSFDGEFKVEQCRTIKSIEEAWEHSNDLANDLGSKWFFYPFHFVTTDSTKTIVASPLRLERFNGLRTKKVVEVFATLAAADEAKKHECRTIFAIHR